MASDITFSHKVDDEAFFTFNLEVERNSGTKDILPVLVSEKLLGNEETYVGNPVCIVGQYRSHNLKTDTKKHLLLNVFAQDIYITDDAQFINNVYLDGYLCKKPVYRRTLFGRQVTDLMLAVPRSCGKSDYIPCIVWGRDAVFASHLEVGTNVILEGRIQSREYQKNVEGSIETRTVYEVSVTRIQKG